MLCNTFADTVLTFGVGQITDYLIGLDTILALATYSNSPLLVANKILVGNGRFWGFTYTERGYIFLNTDCPLNVYWGNPIPGRCSGVDEIKTGD